MPDQEYYLRNKERCRLRANEWNHANRERIKQTRRARAQKIREMLRELKEILPCTDCGHKYPHYVMEFDHVRGVKKASVASLTAQRFTLVYRELDKCEIVCANCHRIRTFQRQQNLGTVAKPRENRR